MANFEVFHWNFSSSINLFFLKRVYYNGVLRIAHVYLLKVVVNARREWVQGKMIPNKIDLHVFAVCVGTPIM